MSGLDLIDRVIQSTQEWKTVVYDGKRYTDLEVGSQGGFRERVSKKSLPVTEPRAYAHPIAFEPQIHLGDRTVAVAEVVLESFGDQAPVGFMVAHRDSNPRNCNLDNLTWIYPGMAYPGYVEHDGTAVTDEDQVRAIHAHRAVGTSRRDIADWFGLRKTSIVSDIETGRAAAHLHPSRDPITVRAMTNAMEWAESLVD